MSKILVVDDDRDIRELVQLTLELEQFQVVSVESGEMALETINDEFSLVILDVMMKGMDGFETCSRIRESYSIPVLFLSAKSMMTNKVQGYEVGADDYLTKPFALSDLTLKVKSLLRRYDDYGDRSALKPEPALMTLRSLTLDLKAHEVYKEGVRLDLTDREFRILELLIQHRGEVLSIETIFEAVWGDKFLYSSSNTVMVHIRNLRKKIEDNPERPTILLNVWGRGYQIV